MSDSETDDPDFIAIPNDKPPVPLANKNRDVIIQEAVNRSKLEGDNNRKKRERRLRKKSQDSGKTSKKIKEMINPNPKGLKSPSTCTTKSSLSSVSANVKPSATSTLCGYWINPISSPAASSCYSQNDKTQICHGCGYTFDNCSDRTYRDVCFHAVLDYYLEAGVHFSTEIVRKVYHQAYLTAVRRDMFEATKLYELSRNLTIPKCMQNGSLKQSLEMVCGHRRYTYLMSQRVFDVQKQLEINKKKDEKMIDDAFKKFE